jgi:short-subunit dehydrogenase
MPSALITGATAGIGAAFARRLADDGLDLVLVARDEKRLTDAAKRLQERFGVTIEALQADLSDDAGIVRVEKRLRQGVDLLVNNAGFGNHGTFLNVPVEDELRMLKVHCEAVLRLTYAALPGMRDRRNGGIINIASVAAFFARGTYSASRRGWSPSARASPRTSVFLTVCTSWRGVGWVLVGPGGSSLAWPGGFRCAGGAGQLWA